MDSHLIEQIEQCAKASNAGQQTFGSVVGTLLQLGVESYFADYRSETTTYYLPDSSFTRYPLTAPDVEISSLFDAAALQAAIRGAQRDEVRYPEFLRLSMAAGCIGYFVWLEGRHVSYFGRRGEVHVERFPS